MSFKGDHVRFLKIIFGQVPLVKQNLEYGNSDQEYDPNLIDSAKILYFIAKNTLF